MMENTEMIKRKGLEFSNGQMDDVTEECGKTESNTEKEYTWLQMEWKKKVNGKKGSE